MNSPAPNRLPRAWYEAPIRGFLATPDDAILGALARGSGDHAVEPAQTQAWLAQIALLKRWLGGGAEGSVYFEFNIPRMGRRIDAVLLLGGVVAVLEFKVGEARFERAALDQAWDYALDLKNFHEQSHRRRIVPILIATEAKGASLSLQAAATRLRFAHDEVAEPVGVAAADMPAMLEALRSFDPQVGDAAASTEDAERWNGAPYKPTPTIIEAARALYARHSVQAIARHQGARSDARRCVHPASRTLIFEIVRRTRAVRLNSSCQGYYHKYMDLEAFTFRVDALCSRLDRTRCRRC